MAAKTTSANGKHSSSRNSSRTSIQTNRAAGCPSSWAGSRSVTGERRCHRIAAGCERECATERAAALDSWVLIGSSRRARRESIAPRFYRPQQASEGSLTRPQTKSLELLLDAINHSRPHRKSLESKVESTMPKAWDAVSTAGSSWERRCKKGGQSAHCHRV